MTTGPRRAPSARWLTLVQHTPERRIYTFDYRSFATGLTFFVFGLAKKLLFADPLSSVSDEIFNGALTDAPALSQAWVGVSAYTFGLYFDFSGYSDMAVGLARMFGIRLPYNFDSPYKATSIVDFWRRWHITLSNWLRDYLCLPKTRSGSIDDEGRRGPAEQRAGRAVESADGSAHPCPVTDAFGLRCNSRCRPQGSGADGPRRR